MSERNMADLSSSPSAFVNLHQMESELIDRVKSSLCQVPQQGTLIKPALMPGQLVYTIRVNHLREWVSAKIKETVPRSVDEAKTQKCLFEGDDYIIHFQNGNERTVSGKFIAYEEPASVCLEVGTRVIAKFRDNMMYAGIILEQARSANNYRYLVFFDKKEFQYCFHQDIRVVCWTSRNVSDDVHAEARCFVSQYLASYPVRTMVQVAVEHFLHIEWQGKWYTSKVLQVDKSLIRVEFCSVIREEWLYRGSPGLSSIYWLTVHKERPKGSLLRSRGFGGADIYKNVPNIEYSIENIVDLIEEKINDNEYVSVPQFDKKIVNREGGKYVQEGTVTEIDLGDVLKPKQLGPHHCSSLCVSWTGHSVANAHRYAPLIKPLMFGFQRIEQKIYNKIKIHYLTPCGVLVKSPNILIRYLQTTRSLLTLDLFSFDPNLNVLRQFKEAKALYRNEDISDGRESVAISCVNELNDRRPEDIIYVTTRKPSPKVNINTDSMFLTGCDCQDNCQDRSKCSCWQLTLQGQPYVKNPGFGYKYHRLVKKIFTGIYECNSMCKCSAVCHNRVVQRPLSVGLQLFNTEKKGWGVRCLHDIPAGTFICLYVGNVFTEIEANMIGKKYGDKYLAELDYIEIAETFKQGYEAQIMEPKRGSHKTKKNSRSQYDNISIKKHQVSVRNLYSDNGDVFIIDAKTHGNVGRYFNHSCSPNMFVQSVFVDTHDLRFPWIALFTDQYVPAGTELTWNYGYDINDGGEIIVCYCGSSNCTGRLL